jgi:hypothetical protein
MHASGKISATLGILQSQRVASYLMLHGAWPVSVLYRVTAIGNEAKVLTQGPILLGSTTPKSNENPSGKAERGFDFPQAEDEERLWNRLPRHRDEEQVKLDVDRSFVYYPNGKADNLTMPP